MCLVDFVKHTSQTSLVLTTIILFCYVKIKNENKIVVYAMLV